MNIFIACGAMPFGPDTINYKSLGGSETSAIMLAKELAKRNHEVTMFCNLPSSGEDAFPSGEKAADGVVYVNIEHYASAVSIHETDLVIIVRDPALAAQHAQTKKKVLWMHDIATKRGMGTAFEQMSHMIDEVWTVSEWHRQQVHLATGYPLEFIKALRNGIVPVETIDAPKISNQLVYAARPERGLDNLIKPNGIMEHLQDFNLSVAMYNHFPDHMKNYYHGIFSRMKEMNNVNFLGSLAQKDLRQVIKDSVAYIYPTQFEETSCIIARECIEQRTPVLTTKTGALPETLKDCGIFFEDWLQYFKISEPEKGSEGWCKLFASFVIDTLNFPLLMDKTREAMSIRTDLYWDDVAAMVEQYSVASEPKPTSRFWSLIQDGDVIAAKAFAEKFGNDIHPDFWSELDQYPFLLHPNDPKYISLGDYYESVYSKGDKENREFSCDNVNNGRHQYFVDVISKLPPGSRILEYASGNGHVIGALAKYLPQYEYVGIEISETAVKVTNDGLESNGLSNAKCYVGHTENLPDIDYDFDAVIMTEIIEHVERPWELVSKVERLVKKGAPVIITVPFGPWEPKTFNQIGKWHQRAHLWSVDRAMIKEVFHKKKISTIVDIFMGHCEDTRPLGNRAFWYPASDEPLSSVDPLKKALRHRSRPLVAAAVIAYNNEDTIIQMLNSLGEKVQFVQIAMGPSTDHTREYVMNWFKDRPYIRYNIINVPKIEPYKFGFDDARNASAQDLENWFDWILWLDTDEYIAGNFYKYLNNSAIEAFIIPQHHFTVVPRGGQMQIDRPARIFRCGRGYKANGHIHEHFEAPGGGPGRAYMLPDVDIGHVGYKDENVRRDRFSRNFPFLEWDHQKPDSEQRPLHHFLWFRDQIHLMRFALQSNNLDVAVKYAKSAIEYYDKYWKEMLSFGAGLSMSTEYLAEAYTILNIGVPMEITIKMEDKSAVFKGRFASSEQLNRLFKHITDEEFKYRMDKYY